MSATIKQIAELADVSRGTVDKVLNNRPGVKPATREKVLQIAKELNYTPNFLGKALVQSKSPLKLGIILTGDYNPFIQDMIEGIQSAQDEFRPFGLEITTKILTTIDPDEQLGMINSLVDQHVTGLAVFPIDAPQIKERLNQLENNHIPIITFNSRVHDIHDLCFIGQNHYKGGRTAAELMGKVIPGFRKVGVIISSRKLSCHQDRLKGFTEQLKEDTPAMEILEVRENQDRWEDAFQITQEYCGKYPEMNAIYITGGGVAGVGDALDAAGKAGQIHVICHDLTPGSIRLLKNGTVDFVLGQSPVNQGYQIVKVLFEYCMKKITPLKTIDIPITISIKESL
ncbi:MAG: LacI family DNA-binding transcriptional regulator [Lachnospiraceae bacterium]|nr:LacI family DNA-binding transcriptional regulator [Lachnospiraceae bacterium]